MKIGYDTKTSYKYVRILVILAMPRAGNSMSFKQGLKELNIELNSKRESVGYNPCFEKLIKNDIVCYNGFGLIELQHRNCKSLPIRGLEIEYPNLLDDILNYIHRETNTDFYIDYYEELKSKLIEYLKEYLLKFSKLDLKTNKPTLRDFYLSFLEYIKLKDDLENLKGYNELIDELELYDKVSNPVFVLRDKVDSIS